MGFIQITLDTTHEHGEYCSVSFEDIGAVSVTFQDAKDQPIFEPTLNTTPLWNHIQVVGLFEDTQNIEKLKVDLAKKFTSVNIQRFKIEHLPDQDWIRNSLEQFHPMHFGGDLWICPSFRTIPHPDAVNVMLDPGLAFGTGSHPTTRLCLQWLADNPPQDQNVIDYGCGSGILGLAACKLGAKDVLFVDHDPQALQSTRDNLIQNKFDPNCFTLTLPEEMPIQSHTDLLLANILADPLVQLVPTFTQLLQPGGRLVLSGILENQAHLVQTAYDQAFTNFETAVDEEWVRITATRR